MFEIKKPCQNCKSYVLKPKKKIELNLENIVKNIDFGMIVTNVGGPGNFSYKQSWNSSHFINSLTEKVLEKTKEDYVVYPFDIHGSDERQFSSPGFRINCISWHS